MPAHQEKAETKLTFRFIALMGFVVSSSAFGIDAILTSVPKIGAELSPNRPELAHLSVTVFFFGIAFGTLFWGPISDAFGRRATMLCGLLLYGTASLLSAFAFGIEMMLVGRFIQGFGSAAMRIVVNAITRDCFEGRLMARVSSFITLLFVIVPGVAPAIGFWISNSAGWRGVFYAFALFSTIGAIWFFLQQPETLAKKKRRPLNYLVLKSGVLEVFGTKHNRLCILVQAFLFAGFCALLTSLQQIFEVTFDRSSSFPFYMGFCSLIGGVLSLTNAWSSVRYGMVRSLRFALVGFFLISFILLVLSFLVSSEILFYSFLIWMISAFITVNTSMANIIALALQPMAHLAGLTTSIQIASASIAGTLLSIPVVFSFDGTIVPLVFANLISCALAAYMAFSLAEDTA